MFHFYFSQEYGVLTVTETIEGVAWLAAAIPKNIFSENKQMKRPDEKKRNLLDQGLSIESAACPRPYISVQAHLQVLKGPGLEYSGLHISVL